MEDVIKDKRFAHIAKDPRFHRMPKGERKVKIDKRFKDMFKDKKFKLKYTVDARGRPVNVSTNENLKKFYELSDSGDSEDSDEESDEEEGSEDAVQDRIQDTDSDASSESSDSDVDDKRFATKSHKSSDSKKSEGEVQSKLDKNKKKKDLNKKQNKKKEIKLTSIKEKANEKSKPVKKKESRKEKGKSKKQDSAESDDEEEEAVKGMKVNKAKKKTEQMSEKILDKEIDYARGEGFLESSSSGSDDNDDDDNDSDTSDSTEFDHKWNEQDSTAVEVEEATHRMAVCNMDWDRIKARDIFFLLSSFKPPQGLVKAVKVYPSEFGKERMAEERLEGPKELKQLRKAEEGKEDEELDKDGSRFQTEKLREYQLLRLKYYYAVADFDSAATADVVYKECDGKEYETSSTKLDLRFIPDDMEFEDEPTSVCTDIPVDYKPNLFYNTALSQSKVDLTWDETDRDRTNKIARQFEPQGEDLEEDDLNAYLASSSDEEGPDYGSLVQQSSSDEEEEDDDDDNGQGEEAKEEKQISKYKMLLQEIDSEEKKKKDMDVQMEITWEPGLKEATEEIVKKKSEKKKDGEATVWEDYLARKKEKKKKKELDRKHQRLVQQTAREPGDDDEDDSEGEDSDIQEGEQAFSDDDLPAGVDMDDDFFGEESTGDRKAQKADKKKKRKKKKPQAEETEEERREKEALSLLMGGEEEEEKRHFSLKKLVDQDKKKKKTKKNKKEQKGDQLKPKQEDDFKLDVEDPRFSAMYNSHLFNLDPSAPEFRKTKGTEALVEEKLKRSKKKGTKSALQDRKPDTSGAKKRKLDDGEPGNKKDESLASLVNSIKMKTKHFKGSKSKV